MTEKKRIEAVAAAAHMVNWAYCQGIKDFTQPLWSEAPKWQKDSAILGVEAVIDDPGITPEQTHEKWMSQKASDGWKYGPIKDAEKKEHPQLVPYGCLCPGQARKDAIFLTTVRELLLVTL